jgi:hypothetical protein
MMTYFVLNRAKAAGSVRPLLILKKIPQHDPEYVLSTQVALLGVFDALYEACTFF